MASANFRLFQANVQSLYKNKAEVHRVLSSQDYSAAIFSETWTSILFENTGKYNIGNYHLILHSRDDSYGGAAVAVSNGMSFARLPSPDVSEFTQVVIVRINNPEIVLASVYISPSISMQDFGNDISKIFDSLRSYRKVIIGGDFNSHHYGWGDDICDRKGEILMDAVNHSDLLILNDGTKTFIPLQANVRSTAIDITLCSSDLLGLLEWTVLDFGIGSHHMGISVEWKTQKGVTAKFFYDKKRIFEEVGKIDQSVIRNTTDLTTHVRRLHKENKKKDIREPKFWWSTEVDEAWQEKNEARRIFNKHSSVQNLINFKRKSAIFQKRKREEIRKKFEEFPDEVGPFTSSKELWLKIGRLTVNVPYGSRTTQLQTTKHLPKLFSICISEKMTHNRKQYTDCTGIQPPVLKTNC